MANCQSTTLRVQPALCHGIPTPPTSSSSSSTRRGTRDSIENEPQERGVRSPGRRRPSLARVQVGSFVMPLRTRRYSSSLTLLRDNTISSAVHASHFSNPTTGRSSPSSIHGDIARTSAFCSLTSNLELARLIDGAALPPVKNTPPLTPRALSNDGSESIKPSLSPSNAKDQEETRCETDEASASRPTPPIGPPKGKLFVKVSSARGLKPSYSPYAVCAFEWIESIAHEPKHDRHDLDQGPRSNDREVGMPIKRVGSDMGRSMAIPMKSRQSSTTSLSDQKSFKNGRQATDPRWDHEAVL